MDIDAYNHIRSGGVGFHEQKRGLIAVWGKEAVAFLDGMITNDMKTLADGQQMLAAFPNAQGRLLALVRVLRKGDRFLIETEEATREKVFNNLFRFTFAGDFFVEDLSEKYRYFELFNAPETQAPAPAWGPSGQIGPADHHFVFTPVRSNILLVCAKAEEADSFHNGLVDVGYAAISDELHETLRIESGIPKYGVDMDETTIVPELGFDGLISYTKGCYIGQEIVARIHFRGHIAKKLAGLITLESEASGFVSGGELHSKDGKSAGRITSVTHPPTLGCSVGLGYVRYDFLAAGTELIAESHAVVVADLPLVN